VISWSGSDLAAHTPTTHLTPRSRQTRSRGPRDHLATMVLAAIQRTSKGRGRFDALGPIAKTAPVVARILTCRLHG
jgi:hypothetical protein